MKNLQGDILYIKDGAGLPIVKYRYDVWGNVTYTTLSFGNTSVEEEQEVALVNPFRYRGYYYDKETGMYYLKTRYYDPDCGHFISPDSYDYLDPETISGVDLYAYCNNNPIKYFNSIISSNSIISFYGTYSLKLTKSIRDILPNFKFEYTMADSRDNPNRISWIYAKAIYISCGIVFEYSPKDGLSFAYLQAGVASFGLTTPKLLSWLGLSDENIFNPNLFIEIGVIEVNASIGLGITGNVSLLSATAGVDFGDMLRLSVKGYVGYGFALDLSKGIKFGSNIPGLPVGYEVSIAFDWIKAIKEFLKWVLI